MRATRPGSRLPAPAAQSILGGRAPQGQPCGLPLTRLAALTGPPDQETTLSIGCKDKSGPATDHADDRSQPSRPCRAGGGATSGCSRSPSSPIPQVDARTKTGTGPDEYSVRR